MWSPISCRLYSQGECGVLFHVDYIVRRMWSPISCRLYSQGECGVLFHVDYIVRTFRENVESYFM